MRLQLFARRYVMNMIAKADKTMKNVLPRVLNMPNAAPVFLT